MANAFFWWTGAVVWFWLMLAGTSIIVVDALDRIEIRRSRIDQG
jgi:hypothetical protein